MTYPIEPTEVVTTVDAFVDRELSDCRRYSNREPLDESGVYSLHILAAEIYALAWDSATRAAESRRSNRHHREKEATPDRAASESTEAGL